jgi:hypothetical protein
MARVTSTGLPLPLELAVKIVKCCAEHEIAEDPNDRYEYFLAYENTDDRF